MLTHAQADARALFLSRPRACVLARNSALDGHGYGVVPRVYSAVESDGVERERARQTQRDSKRAREREREREEGRGRKRDQPDACALPRASGVMNMPVSFVCAPFEAGVEVERSLAMNLS